MHACSVAWGVVGVGNVCVVRVFVHEFGELFVAEIGSGQRLGRGLSEESSELTFG